MHRDWTSFLPSLLQQTGLEIQPGTPEYNSLASYIKKNSGWMTF